MKPIESEKEVTLSEETSGAAGGRLYSAGPADFALLIILFMTLGSMLLHP